MENGVAVVRVIMTRMHIYVPTNQQYADTLTKVVSTPNFVKNLPFLLGQSTTDIRQSRQDYNDQYARSLLSLVLTAVLMS